MTSKPSLSVSDQVALLTNRGLAGDPLLLQRALLDHGYFRLSGYWRYFQVDPANGNNAFEHGTKFEDVYDLYQADAELRNLLLEGMAEIEISTRAILTARLCAAGGDGLEYRDAATYRQEIKHDGTDLRAKLLSDIGDDILRSKERHVVHYRSKSPSDVPFWVATEALSFGTLSRMYGLLQDEPAAKMIASRFGYQTTPHFATNLRAVVAFRNVCAHHSRIWNRHIRQDVPRIFSQLVEKGLTMTDYRNTPWGVISVVSDMVNRVRRDDTFRNALTSLVPTSGPFWTGLISPSHK